MKQVIRYEALDGSIWLTEAEAVTRDTVCEEVYDAMQALKPVPETTAFYNGEGYIQQDIEMVKAARATIAGLIKKYGLDVPYVMAAARRIDSVDRFGREWGQPCFAGPAVPVGRQEVPYTGPMADPESSEPFVDVFAPEGEANV